MALEPVRLVFTKWDGSLHWHFRLQLLGEDEHGVWLAAPSGTSLQRGDEPPTTEHDGFLVLVPPMDTWMALWNVEDDPELYVDVTSVAQWSGDEVTAVDFDLDVVRYRDGRVALLDEDEFEEHQVEFGYPGAVVETVAATAQRLLDVVACRVEPFGTHALRWLHCLQAAQG